MLTEGKTCLTQLNMENNFKFHVQLMIIILKPTDTHQYLHRTSDHPKTVKKSIPYGVGTRMKMKMTTRITRKSSQGTCPVGDTGDMMLKNSYIKLKTLTEKNSSNTETNLNRKSRNEYFWLSHIRIIYLT